MSTTSLFLDSPVSADTLYEEDKNISTSLSKNELDNDMNNDREKPSSSSRRKKSKNVAIIEDFLTHFIRYGFPLGVDLRMVELQRTLGSIGYTAILQDFEIDPLDPGFEDLHAILSEILEIKVQYKVVGENGTEEKLGFFVAKLPPRHGEDRQLAALSNAHRREIEFYTQTVPSIYCWMTGVEQEMSLSIPDCLYGKYNRPLDDKPVEGVRGNLGKAESILVLEDIRPEGFGKRHYTQELSLQEAKAALREMARIHAITWSLQEREGEPLAKIWPFYYKAEYLAMLYEALLEDGIPRFESYLRELVDANQDYTAVQILERLSEFKSKGLRDSLLKLLVAGETSVPSCLVHMDFWCDNIFFRGSDDEVVSSNDSETVSDDSDALECRILDWQMFSIGRPTNDIALLLFTGLDPATRRNSTNAILEFYHRVFKETTERMNVPIGFDMESLRAEYHTSQLLAVLQVIASIDLVLGEDVAEERLMEAVKDLLHQNLI